MPALLTLFLTVTLQAGANHIITSYDLSFSPPALKGVVSAGWRELKFKKIKKQTKYTLLNESGSYHIKAESRSSASGMVYPLSADISKTPILKWRWKITNTLIEGDAREKDGDDYAARIYVMFKYEPKNASSAKRIIFSLAKLFHGQYPPDSALNYIWANKIKKGTTVLSAFTRRSRLIAQRSGDEDSGKWYSERVNIYQDYVKYFGKEPPALQGIAIMTDSDNTGESAISWYSNITLTAE